jgi:hypothetical protein
MTTHPSERSHLDPSKLNRSSSKAESTISEVDVEGNLNSTVPEPG